MTTHNIIAAVAGYIITVGGFVYWIFKAKPKNIDPTPVKIFWMAVRIAPIFILLFLACNESGRSIWVVYIVGFIVGILIALLEMVDFLGIEVLGIVALGVLFALQQWILGFPYRKELYLKSDCQCKEIEPDDGKSAIIGLSGIVETALRPSGKITIDGVTYEGSCDYGFVDKGDEVVVIDETSFGLLVRPLKDDE